jgi:hypothetical protein
VGPFGSFAAGSLAGPFAGAAGVLGGTFPGAGGAALCARIYVKEIILAKITSNAFINK